MRLTNKQIFLIVLIEIFLLPFLLPYLLYLVAVIIYYGYTKCCLKVKSIWREWRTKRIMKRLVRKFGGNLKQGKEDGHYVFEFDDEEKAQVAYDSLKKSI